MCGRFDLHSEPVKIIKEFRVDKVGCDYSPSYNVAPSQNIVIVKDDGKRHLVQCRWGFVPSWAADPDAGYRMINARAESVAEKPAFRDAFRQQRCIVVADGFYEWRKVGKKRLPVYVRLKSGRLMGFAGLYSSWTSGDGETICTCAIITTGANNLVGTVHDRMPVIIPKEREEIWLDPKISSMETLLPLLQAYPSEEMEMYDVSPMVNDPLYDDPGGIDRIVI